MAELAVKYISMKQTSRISLMTFIFKSMTYIHLSCPVKCDEINKIRASGNMLVTQELT